MVFGMNQEERSLFQSEFEKGRKVQKEVRKKIRRTRIIESAEFRSKPFGEKVKTISERAESRVASARKGLKRLSKSSGFKLKGIGVREPLLGGGGGRKRKRGDTFF